MQNSKSPNCRRWRQTQLSPARKTMQARTLTRSAMSVKLRQEEPNTGDPFWATQRNMMNMATGETWLHLNLPPPPYLPTSMTGRPPEKEGKGPKDESFFFSACLSLKPSSVKIEHMPTADTGNGYGDGLPPVSSPCAPFGCLLRSSSFECLIQVWSNLIASSATARRHQLGRSLLYRGGNGDKVGRGG